MTLDGLTLHACIKELNDSIIGAKVQKVLMPAKEEIVLQLYAPNSGTLRLCISADAGDCAIYLTKSQKQNPKTPPVFCMFLRKYLTGSRIDSIEQCGLDRVVKITFDSKDDMLHPIKLTMVIEIMGKYSNIILTNDAGKILDSIKHVSVDLSSLRQVLPGMLYENPPQEKYNPLSLSQVSMCELFYSKQDTTITAKMTASFAGLSSQTAQEILFRSGIQAQLISELTEHNKERLANVMHGFLQETSTSAKPCVQFNTDGLPVFFSVIPYETYPIETRRQFSNTNEMLDYYYSRRAEIFRLKQQKVSLTKTVNQILSKLNKKINIYQASLEDFKKSEKIQSRADYITANLYQLKKGMKSFETIDYSTGQPLTIALDVSTTPQELAQKLYKKIGKLKTAARINTQKLEDSLEEQEFLLGVLHFIECSTHPEDIADIKHTLQKSGYIAAPPKNKRAQEETVSEPLRFTSPSGYTILVGKNDRQNDIITMRIAQKDDIWFHTQKIAGSHVLLITNGAPMDDIDDETIVYAAQLAAQHSRAKQSGKTAVDYTYRKNIKKPPAAKPGKVIYDEYFTVYVDAVPIQTHP